MDWTIDSIREKLMRLEKEGSFQKPDFYRQFTKTLTEVLNDFKVVKSDETVRTVGVVFASPERAIAKFKDSVTTKLPLISVGFNGIEVDSQRRRPSFNIVQSKTWDKEKRQAIRVYAMAPVAADLKYSINIWAKYIEDMNQITEQLMLKFNPSVAVNTSFGDDFEIFIEDVSDMSDLTPGDKQDRVIRRSVKVTAKGYIPSRTYRFTNTGQIEEFLMEAEVKTDGN